jgi:hypothetical protein
MAKKRNEPDELTIVDRIITEKLNLIQDAKNFLRLLDTDFDEMSDEIYLWMDKHKVNQTTITYLQNLVMDDENQLDEFINDEIRNN